MFLVVFFFFNDTATTEIYTLSLHDALPIFVGADEDVAVGDGQRREHRLAQGVVAQGLVLRRRLQDVGARALVRSEEHTSELQSRQYLVCRLLLEKKQLRHTRETHEITIIIT